MRKFEFSSDLKLDIAGHLFIITCNERNADKIDRFGADSLEYAQKIDVNQDGNQAAQEAVEFMRLRLDDILGAGACDKIFSGREENIFDFIDVAAYIFEEFRDLANQIVERRKADTDKAIKLGLIKK